MGPVGLFDRGPSPPLSGVFQSTLAVDKLKISTVFYSSKVKDSILNYKVGIRKINV